MKKEKYQKPEIIPYGTVTEVTAGGAQPNQDVPFGSAPSTAYPPWVPPGS